MRRIETIPLTLTLALTTMAQLVAQDTLFTWYGDSALDSFGNIAAAGDIDGDGREDVIIGSRFDDSATHSGGSAFVYAGVNGKLLFSFYGPVSYSSFGLSNNAAGDIDTDGFPDLVVGAPYEDDFAKADVGAVYVYSGHDGTLLWHRAGDRPGAKYGYSVDGMGDVDGDGYGDVLTTAPSDDLGGFDSGSAFVLSGTNGAILYTVVGDSAHDRFGSFGRRVGDLDQDGVIDFGVGAPLDDDAGDACGSVRLFSGRTASPLHTLFGSAAGAHLGYAIDDAGDQDGDGIADVILGDFHHGAAGAALLISGQSGNLLRTWPGLAAGDLFGTSVCSLGDLDGDGRAELAIGAPAANLAGTGAGRAFIMRGGSGTLHFTIDASGPGDGMGWVGGGGDLDGDGRPDLLLGSTQDDVNGEKSGSARAIRGCGSCPVEMVGHGCAGGGPAPTLTLSGDLVAGGEVILAVQGLPDSLPAWLALGTPAAPTALASGCSLYVDPAGAWLVPLGVLPSGMFATTIALPTLSAGNIGLQALCVDPMQSAVVAASQAVIAHIQIQ